MKNTIKKAVWRAKETTPYLEDKRQTNESISHRHTTVQSSPSVALYQPRIPNPSMRLYPRDMLLCDRQRRDICVEAHVEIDGRLYCVSAIEDWVEEQIADDEDEKDVKGASA